MKLKTDERGSQICRRHLQLDLHRGRSFRKYCILSPRCWRYKHHFKTRSAFDRFHDWGKKFLLVSMLKYAGHVCCAHYKPNAIHQSVGHYVNQTCFHLFTALYPILVCTTWAKCSLSNCCEFTFSKTVFRFLMTFFHPFLEKWGKVHKTNA
jgi:hypothetical protein